MDSFQFVAVLVLGGLVIASILAVFLRPHVILLLTCLATLIVYSWMAKVQFDEARRLAAELEAHAPATDVNSELEYRGLLNTHQFHQDLAPRWVAAAILGGIGFAFQGVRLVRSRIRRRRSAIENPESRISPSPR